MKSLIVFYSLTGNTRQLVSKIGSVLQSDLEEIKSRRRYEGIWGYLSAVYHSLTSREIQIDPPTSDLEAYDVVIVAGPIWAGHIAPPVKAFLSETQGRLRAVGFCITHGGSSPKTAFREMEELAGMSSIASLSVTAGEIKKSRDDLSVRSFANTLQDKLGRVQRVA